MICTHTVASVFPVQLTITVLVAKFITPLLECKMLFDILVFYLLGRNALLTFLPGSCRQNIENMFVVKPVFYNHCYHQTITKMCYYL